jgi:alpha-ketoglutarate-dependent taurine dioxygenase
MDLPLVIESARPYQGLVDWIQDNRELMQSRLTTHGALLFRGFDVSTAEDFRNSMLEFCGGRPLLEYAERSSPRTRILEGVYTSTEYPPEREIFLHNEQSYNLQFPRFIAFYCHAAAHSGGQTTVADTRCVLRQIEPRLSDKLRDVGYCYVRHFGCRAGMSWKEAFGALDADSLEAYCSSNEIAFEWLGERGGSWLRTEQVRPVIARHPVSHELVWFNHLTFFHRSTLPADLRELLDHVCGARPPHATFYGDRTVIDEASVTTLRDAYRSQERIFDWRPRDVLVLDNMLVAHGRKPFQGSRKVMATMADLCAWPTVAAVLD